MTTTMMSALLEHNVRQSWQSQNDESYGKKRACNFIQQHVSRIPFDPESWVLLARRGFTFNIQFSQTCKDSLFRGEEPHVFLGNMARKNVLLLKRV